PTLSLHSSLSSTRLPTRLHSLFFFFSTAPPPTHIYTLPLHDALPISAARKAPGLPARPPKLCSCRSPSWFAARDGCIGCNPPTRSEEHTSELQSRRDLVCRLLLEKKKRKLTLVRPTCSLVHRLRSLIS